ncbi:MAG: ParB/RepB/Spo0J family partition protein [Chloroflexota bacterium]|nr:ParB/RepB/Spo0J family partition protein [Chloroflexota bacterium]
MTHHIGQQVELRVACGPFVRGQVVTIQALETIASPSFALTCCGHRTTATAEDFGAVQGELPTTEELDMARKNSADLSANSADPAGDQRIEEITELGAAPVEYPVGQLVALPLALIDPDPDNERADLGDLAALAASMAVKQEEPIQVYATAEGRYMNKTGHRRGAAAHLLGWPTIAALIVEPPADARRRTLGRIVSNLLREDPNIMLLAERLRDTLAGGDVDQTALARQLGKSQSWISNTMRLLHLPEPVRALISAGKLTAGHGVELLRIRQPDVEYWSGQPTGRSAADEQVAMAEEAIRDLWSVGHLAQRITSYLNEQNSARQRAETRARQAAEAVAALRAATAEKGRIAQEAQARGDDPQAAQAAAQQAPPTKEQEARDREATRRRERGAVAAAVIDRVIGYTPGAPPSLEHLRLLGRMALTATGRFGHGDGQAADPLLQALEAAPDQASLLVILGTIARTGLPLDSEERALAGHYYVQQWADQRWCLNVRIADELLRQGKIVKISHTTLVKDKPRPAAASGDAAVAA